MNHSPTTLDRLRPLELHLDLYGLMSYRENNIAAHFSDLLCAIRRMSEDKGVGVHPHMHAMMCKVDAIFERLGLGTHESMKTILGVGSTSTSDDAVDEVETLSLTEFSSLPSNARELLEMLASSGISSSDKQELCEKIDRIWSGWRVRIEDVEIETTRGGFRRCLGEGGFSSVYKGR